MKECIILAGGLGTRLQSVVKDVPKCMAEVAGNPFIKYILDYLEKQDFDHIILALGYKSDIIIDWINSQNYKFDISWVIEKEALGTGGAIKLAISKSISQRVLVINGDTFFELNIELLYEFHSGKSADLSIALKPMLNFDRYGSVGIDQDGKITQFNEKQYCTEGLINGGVYLIEKEMFEKLNLPDKFSFEKEVMEKSLDKIKIYGCKQDGYFIDIGIPSDFEKANQDFRK